MSAQHLSPLIINSESLNVHQGEFAYIVGTYKELNVAKKSTVTRYVGRAYIELLGGGSVVLETDEAGIRSAEEIEKYRGKTVVVYGTTRVGQTVWGGGQVASLVMTALSGFSKIDIVNPQDFSPHFDTDTQLIPIHLREDLQDKYVGQWVKVEGTLVNPSSSAKASKKEDRKLLDSLGIDTSIFDEFKKMEQSMAEINKMFKIKNYDLTTAIQLNDGGLIKLKDTRPSPLLDSNRIGTKLSIVGRLQGTPPYGCYLIELQKVAEIDSSVQPLIQNHTDIKRYDGEQVVVIGRYKEINVAQHPKQTVYIGRAALTLEDGSSVAIELDDKGIRTKRELETCKGKRVKVVGTLHSSIQLWGKAEEAAIVSPCLSTIQSIEVLD